MIASRIKRLHSSHCRIVLILLSVSGLIACSLPNTSSTGVRGTSEAGNPSNSGRTGNCVRHDLQSDEDAGGHTLRKHTGRTDEQLLERLNHERNISGASTYTDRAAAECAVGGALAQNADKINRWAMREGGHSNFVVDYAAPSAIGRTLNRGDSVPQPCNHAKIVLAWDGPGSFHVLTTYPECR